MPDQLIERLIMLFKMNVYEKILNERESFRFYTLNGFIESINYIEKPLFPVATNFWDKEKFTKLPYNDLPDDNKLSAVSDYIESDLITPYPILLYTSDIDPYLETYLLPLYLACNTIKHNDYNIIIAIKYDEKYSEVGIVATNKGITNNINHKYQKYINTYHKLLAFS